MNKLLTIQNLLSVEKKRTGHNGDYKFWHYEDILREAKPICSSNQCFLTFSEEPLPIGSNIYIKSTVYLIDQNGEQISFSSGISRESFSKDMEIGQLTETATSYARKAALTGLFALHDANEPDYNDYSDRTFISPLDKLILIKEQAQKNGDIQTAAKLLDTISKNNPNETQKALNDYADYIKNNPIEMRL